MTVDTSRLAAPGRRVARAEVTDRPLDLATHVHAVGAPEVGATVTFVGVVRDHDRGRAVTSITYLAHPTAGEALERVARTIAERFAVDAIAVSHRVGDLGVGECALVAAVSAAHRAEAFEATSALVEEIKREVPVWKRQVMADRSAEWVGCP